MSDSSIDQQSFRRILNRNVGLPLGFGFLSAFFFSAIVYYLLNVNHTAERSVEEVAVAHETFKVLIDLESGMRGYLIAGEEVFLQPYLNGLPVLERGMAELREQMGENPLQLRRIERIEMLRCSNGGTSPRPASNGVAKACRSSNTFDPIADAS